MITELQVSIECKKCVDVYQIEAILPEPRNAISSTIINELINGKEFHSVNEIKDYIIEQLNEKGIYISHEVIRI